MNGKKIAALLLCICLNGIAAEKIWESDLRIPSASAEWTLPQNANFGNDGLTLNVPARVPYSIATKKFEPGLFAGKILKLTAEVKGENILSAPKSYEGASLQFTMTSNGKRYYAGVKIPQGSYDWKWLSGVFHVPENLDEISLKALFQNGGGKFSVRNLKIEVLGTAINTESVANMELADQTAGDGRGGWTDQGPKQDARAFSGKLYSNLFSGIPFHASPTGKNVITMYSKDYFQKGPKTLTVPIPRQEKAKTLYLLHTSSWSVGNVEKIGSVILTDTNGKQQIIPIRSGIDAADWYRKIAVLKNGYPALKAKSGDGQAIAAYISKFSVDPALAEIKSATFATEGKSIWLILAATLTRMDIPLPEDQKFTIHAGKQWLPVQYPPENKIKPGSAFDLDAFMPKKSVDQMGRVIVRNGHFTFEKNPELPIRFLVCSIHPRDLMKLSHEQIDAYARDIRRNGYNMVRAHFLDTALMIGATKPLEFNPTVLDRFEYMISAMKKNGIYLNLDLMTSWIGYTPGNIHKNNDPKKSFKNRIAFDPAVRENWIKGVEKILCRVNQYTGTKLVDDPVMVMAVGFNEQEFGFWNSYDETLVGPYWRAFLKERYGTIDKLKQAWGKNGQKITTFESIPCFKTYFASPMTNDAELFRHKSESRILDWYVSEMKRLGYRGYVTGFNCGKSQTYNMTRLSVPIVAINAYHGHPTEYINRNSSLDQQSPSEISLNFFRGFICTRQPGKPLVVTEHNVVFWNRYRYEQAFATGAYAALQNFDSLACHTAPVNVKMEYEMQPFVLCMDPVAKASEFLTFFLFVRGDVKPAKPTVRIRVSEDEVFSENGPKGGLPTEQSLLSLITGVSVECIPSGGKPTPLHPRELAFKIGTPDSIIVNTAGFSNTVDNPAANASDIVRLLKERNYLDRSNRSDGRVVFESENRETLLNSSKKYIEVNTPRLQGICAMAGTRAALPDFEIMKMTCNGNLAVVSLDGMKNIRNANRLMLIYATNALNSEMTFTTPEMNTLLSIGKLPAVIEAGAFSVAIRHMNPEKLSLYPLDLAGNRIKKIAPEKIADGKAYFSVDMARDGATFFFELSAE